MGNSLLRKRLLCRGGVTPPYYQDHHDDDEDQASQPVVMLHGRCIFTGDPGQRVTGTPGMFATQAPSSVRKITCLQCWHLIISILYRVLPGAFAGNHRFFHLVPAVMGCHDPRPGCPAVHLADLAGLEGTVTSHVFESFTYRGKLGKILGG